MATKKNEILKKIKDRKIRGLEIMSGPKIDDPMVAGFIPLLAARTSRETITHMLNR